MTAEYVFTYYPPAGDPLPLRAALAPNPETKKEEYAFPLSQLARALGYSEKNASKVTPKCHPRYVLRVMADTGRPVKAVTRYGVSTATPESETPRADHFHDWVRAVVLPSLSIAELTPADVARLESEYLRSQLAKLQERLDAAVALVGTAPLPESAKAAPAAYIDAKAQEQASQEERDRWKGFGDNLDLDRLVGVLSGPPETAEARAEREKWEEAERASQDAAARMRAHRAKGA